MRAYVYTVRVGDKWVCRLSLDWRVDLRFWYGKKAGQAGGIEGRNGGEDARLGENRAYEGRGVEVWMTVSSIPLGLAVYVTEQWEMGPLEPKRLIRLLQEADPQVMEWVSQGDLQIKQVKREDVCRSAQRLQEVACLGVSDWGVGSKSWNGNGNGNEGMIMEGVWNGDLWDDIDWGSLKRVALRLAVGIQGRSLLAHELQDYLTTHGMEDAALYWRTLAQLAYVQGLVELRSGLVVREAPRRFPLLRRQRELRCLRCGSRAGSHRRTACATCGSPGCAYCEACLAMGRSRACVLLLHGTAAARLAAHGAAGTVAAGCARAAGRAHAHATEPGARWRLSEAQHDASCAALHFLQQPCAAAGNTPAARGGAGVPSFLLWAVTGAGKTEMIFPLIAHALERDQRVLIATPRRDVVLELAPRLAQAFPDSRLATLYGGSSDRWMSAEITLSTTHQLMRFYHMFDLVIIDELDAFPYHNNEQLQYAAKKACKPDGRFILLSATPPDRMQRDVRQGRLPHAKVPVRFHRHPLPVPKRLTLKPLRLYLERRALPIPLIKALTTSITRGAQVFIFITRIKQVDPLVDLLRRHFPNLPIEGTSSEDTERAEKVIRFRQGVSRMLVTTTILERGVTIPKSDVFILDADSALFDAASLVQMAGRAGRSLEDPAGNVMFCASSWNRAQQHAVRQITSMNRIARRQGYLNTTSQRRKGI
ncbi:DEAD/DEAH box helicase [Paenibacillus terrigena]|uniref:DEAD/DEAH box helicase n=1 Tax=Paenibacillus terrigena TaxID=369333 RepID=UPI0003793A21|nr:helicase-related protein [Paenibacillus terrigena]